MDFAAVSALYEPKLELYIDLLDVPAYAGVDALGKKLGGWAKVAGLCGSRMASAAV